MINFEAEITKPGQTAFFSNLQLSIEDRLPSTSEGSDIERCKYQIISNFLQEHQQKALAVPNQTIEFDSELESPLTKKHKNNANLSHFSSQINGGSGNKSSQNNSNFGLSKPIHYVNAETLSNSSQNFDDSSCKKNTSLSQEFNLQNFIRKRNSEILKNLSRGSICPINSEQKENNFEENFENTSNYINFLSKPPKLLNILNFEDHYALKRVSMNLGNSKGITPLILLHKKNLMKKVMDGNLQNMSKSQLSDSDNNTDEENSQFLEEEHEFNEISSKDTYQLRISILQSLNFNFNEIINENKKKVTKPGNLQEMMNLANMMDNLGELDINDLIKKRMMSKNIEIIDRKEQIYRKCTLKQLKMTPFYLFGYESSSNCLLNVVKDQFYLKKIERKIVKKNEDINALPNFEELEEKIENNDLKTCEICLGSIENNEKSNVYNTFIRTKDENVYFTSFQSKFLHSHQFQLEGNTLKNSNLKFIDHIRIQMKQCSDEFVKEISNDLNKNDNFHDNIKKNLIETLSNPKLFIKDLGSTSGTFVKLKSNNPLILDKNLLIMLTAHLGFYVEEICDGSCLENNTEYTTINLNEDFFKENEIFSEEQDGKNTWKKENLSCLKLIFVKRDGELNLFEEYQKTMIIFKKYDNPNNNIENETNCLKIGKKKTVFIDDNEEKPSNFFEKIHVRYESYIGFDKKAEIWFLVAFNDEKITTSLTSLHNGIDNFYLRYEFYNTLQENITFNTNADFYNCYKNQEKIIYGINTIDNSLKSEIDGKMNGSLVEDFMLDSTEYSSKPSCWVCLARFNLLQKRFYGENIEVGGNSILKFGTNQICLRVWKMKELLKKKKN